MKNLSPLSFASRSASCFGSRRLTLDAVFGTAPRVRRDRIGRTAAMALSGAIALLVASALPAQAQVPGPSVWTPATPASPGDWNTAANWNPTGVPNSATATAQFGNSSVHSVTLSGAVQVSAIYFVFGSGSYTIDTNGNSLVISGAGVSNNSGSQQTFNVASGNVYVTAGTAGGTNDIAYDASGSGIVYIQDTGSAGSAVYTTTGPSSAVVFAGTSSGTGARYIGDGGSLYVTRDLGTALTLGSLEGTGGVRFSQFLGAATQELRVGALNTDTTFSGTIIDDGAVGTLTKVGTRNLTLTGVNTYAGGTNVNAGMLIIDNDGTTTFGQLGSGTVTVNGSATVSTNPFGTLVFQGDAASAGNRTFVVNASAAVSGGGGGVIEFYNASTASTGTFTVKGNTSDPDGAGVVNFHDTATADFASLAADGGTINFEDASTAGTAQFIVNGETGAAVKNGVVNFNANSTTALPGASASGAMFTINGSSAVEGVGGSVNFYGNSTGGDSDTVFGTFNLYGGSTSGAGGGSLTFNDTSDAGYAVITANGTDDDGGLASKVTFLGSASAGNATITNEGSDFSGDPASSTGGGITTFSGTSTAGSATLIANGGEGSGGAIVFAEDSLGGTAAVQVNDNGFLDIGTHNSGSVSIGSLEGSGNVFLGANNLTVGGLNSDTTFSGVIQDGGISSDTGGSFTKEGTGKLTLTGSSTYTGETIVNGGTLEFGTGGSLYTNGTVAGSITVNDGATLLFSRNDTFGTADSTLPVALTVNAGGTVQSNNSFTALKNATFNGGTLLTNGGVAADYQAFGLEGTVVIGGTSATYFTSAAMGARLFSIAIAPPVNDFNGINIGQQGVDAATTFQVADATGDDGSDLIVQVSISDMGGQTSSLIKTGLGTMEIQALADYTGSTTVSAGILKIAAGGEISQTGAVTVDGLLEDNATLTVDGFESNASLTATGAITIGDTATGALNIFNGGTASNSGLGVVGAQSGSVGTVLVDGTNSSWSSTGGLTVGQSGTGTLTVQNGAVVHVGGGTGTLTLGENETGQGTLNISNGGAAGTLDAAEVHGGAGTAILNFNQTDSAYTFAPIITGNVTVNLDALGTTTLTGASTYTGPTNINAGTLLVDGSIGSGTTTVYSAATLGGTGTIGGALVNSGLVSPGHSPGTLTVSGPYTQNSSGTLRIEIGGRNPAEHDLLAVGGNANLGGRLQLVRLNEFQLQLNDRIVFLTAGGGVNGTFARVENEFATGTIVSGKVVYSANEVSLGGVQGSFVEVPDMIDEQFPDLSREFSFLHDLSPNQLAIAKALDELVKNGHSKLIDYLNGRSLPELPGDFDKIAPEELTAIFTISNALANIQSLNLQRRTDDLRTGANGFSAAGLAINGQTPSFSGNFMTGAAGPTGDGKESKTTSVDENKWGAFLSGTGEWIDVDGDGNARGYDISTGGFTLGVDYKVNANFALGVAAGYAGTSADLTDNGRVWVNGGKLGLYATYFTGGFYTDTAVTGGYNSYDTKRSALQGTARGSTDGGELNVLFGTGYDFKMGAFTLGPTGTFQYTLAHMDGYTEHGSLAPLDIAGKDAESVRSAFGFKANYDWKLGGIVVRPELRASWQHEYGDKNNDLSASFANGEASGFTVSGPEIGRDSLLLGAGVAVQFNERTSAYLYYDGELARENYDSHSVTGGLRLSF